MKSWKTAALITGIATLILIATVTTVAVANDPPGSSGSQGSGQGGTPGYYGGGMMGGYGGMMGPGTMGGYGGMMGGGMMGPGYGYYSQADPVSVDEARTAVESYLATLGNEDLEVAEIMVFTNHSYAQVVEKSSGIGAFEVLVDHANLTVYPEMGPNMMWNLKYGHMSGIEGTGMGSCQGTGGGMMGGFTGPQDASVDMTVTPEQAIQAAQRYLDAYLPGTQADEHADVFYGYYTIHTLKDGETVGMLSVNGYTEQVFYHSWHGDLVEMAE